jgi:hypothetical protein
MVLQPRRQKERATIHCVKPPRPREELSVQSVRHPTVHWKIFTGHAQTQVLARQSFTIHSGDEEYLYRCEWDWPDL